MAACEAFPAVWRLFSAAELCKDIGQWFPNFSVCASPKEHKIHGPCLSSEVKQTVDVYKRQVLYCIHGHCLQTHFTVDLRG